MTDISLPFSTAASGRAAQYLSVAWYRSGKNIWNFLRLIGEMAVLRLLSGVPISYYLRGGLDTVAGTLRNKLGFVGPKRYARLVWQLNDPAYRKISQNKLAEKALLEALAIPTPEFLGYFERKGGRTNAGRPLRSEADMRAFLISVVGDREVRRICFKLTEGWSGIGFLAVDVRISPCGIPVVTFAQGPLDKRYRVSVLLEKLGNSSAYVIEPFIEQHPDYAVIHPQSVNSYRFWIGEDDFGVTRPLLGYIRFGCAGALVDNGLDKLIAPLDVETGRIGQAYSPSLQRLTTDTHPDTGHRITGVRLPFYYEARALACDALRPFPHIRFAGVDIAVGKEGPVVLELNVQPSENGAATCRVPIKEVFGALAARERS